MTCLPKLAHVSQSVLDDLLINVEENLPRYRQTGFEDLAAGWGWNVELGEVRVDRDALAALDCSAVTAEVEIRNSLQTFDALPGMTCALARHEQIWVRLTHVECINYSRMRWLPSHATSITGLVMAHFFGGGVTGVRDDNAVGRLWWNAAIAKIFCPDDVERGLRAICGRPTSVQIWLNARGSQVVVRLHKRSSGESRPIHG